MSGKLDHEKSCWPLIYPKLFLPRPKKSLLESGQKDVWHFCRQILWHLPRWIQSGGERPLELKAKGEKSWKIDGEALHVKSPPSSSPSSNSNRFSMQKFTYAVVHQFDEINSSICISLGTWKLNNINFSFRTLVLKENRKRNWDKADLEVKASSHSNTSWLESSSLLSCWA